MTNVVQQQVFRIVFVSVFILVFSLVTISTVRAQTNEISLVWQADTYTPPLYRGKALYTTGASYQVIAVPPSGRSPQNLVFTWEKDSRVLGSLSGVGRNVLTLSSDVVDTSAEIRVVVETTAGTEVGTGQLVLRATEPSVSLYQQDPARGVLFGRALSSFSLRGDEVTLTAVPYYFSDTPFELGWGWELNGDRLLQEQNLNITLRRPEEGSGQAVLVFEAEHPEKLMQEARSQTTITFE